MAGKKKMTLIQFQAWLEGVEEMHPEDWCPTADQWKLIRNKIKTIVELKVDTSVLGSSGTGNTLPANFPSFAPGIAPAPEIPSSIPSGPVEEASPESQNLLKGDGTGKSVTPNSEHGDASPFS